MVGSDHRFSMVDQKTGEVELSPRVGDQAAIAHVHEIGPSAEVLKEAVSTDEELQVLSCRCCERFQSVMRLKY